MDKVNLFEIETRLKDEGFVSNKSVYDMLYHIRLLKYVRQSHLQLIDNRYIKICSFKKLDKLIELELLKNPREDIFISTTKSLTLLTHLKYNTKLLPKDPEGKGSINEINNTEIFVQALKLPDFITLLYPDFKYLRPDALLIRGTKQRYKLEFLEVEASKSNWDNWLDEKRINYLKLSGCKDAYHYWKDNSYHLDLVCPDIKDFKFSISIIGNITKDFGTGFNFKRVIND